MKKSLFTLAIAACAAILAQPAMATTFPTLTTIYVVSGVMGGASNAPDVATNFHCTNASGLSASIRFLVLFNNGAVAGSSTRTLAHANSISASTHETVMFNENTLLTPFTSLIRTGAVIEATESGVFCTAMIVDAAATVPNGIALHLVRVNPHPGTVE